MTNSEHATLANQRSGTFQVPESFRGDQHLQGWFSLRTEYTKLEENSPEDDHFQLNLSGWSNKWKSCSVSQRWRYWTTTLTVRAKAIPLTQRLPCSVSWTIRDLLVRGGIASRRSRASWYMEQLLSQWSIQKRAWDPSPTCTDIEASKKSIMCQLVDQKIVSRPSFVHVHPCQP
jgi:hypothetical protein